MVAATWASLGVVRYFEHLDRVGWAVEQLRDGGRPADVLADVLAALGRPDSSRLGAPECLRWTPPCRPPSGVTRTDAFLSGGDSLGVNVDLLVFHLADGGVGWHVRAD